MSQEQPEIEYKRLNEALVVTRRMVVIKRDELQPVLDKLTQALPKDAITGPAFCIFQFVTSVKDGHEVEVGFPIKQAVQVEGFLTRTQPEMEVLSLRHQGSFEGLSQAYNKMYGFASEHALISDEFCREVYLDAQNITTGGIELQFVIHNWNKLLSQNLERVLGEGARQQVMHGAEHLTHVSTLDERFEFIKGALTELQVLADKEERYDILSSCAHVYPKGQIEKLRMTYEQARGDAEDALTAIDAVITFMEKDPGWGERPIRKGRTIYATKQPRDPVAYEKAQTELEKRKAYCFCPLVRSRLDTDMPAAMIDSFCYCGAGWYRQQWEGAISRPVKIDILQSVLRGDDRCQFAIYLPDDL